MQPRINISLDKGWEFVRKRSSCRWCARPSTDDALTLPHCWNEQDAFQDGVAYYRGWGSYRRSFDIAEYADPTGLFCWRLVSEGFYGTGDVWLNGKRLGKVDGQYLGFDFEVSDALRFDGDNVLGIRITNRCASDVLPGIKMPDFLLYGGLSGRLWLERVPRVRIDRQWTRIVANGGEVQIDAVLVGALSDAHQFEWQIVDEDLVQVCDATEPALASALLDHESRGDVGSHFVTKLSVTNPRLWDVDSPHLYLAKGILKRDGNVVDSVCIRFGIRHAEFRPREGFFLNGKRVALRGCNRHESMPGFGRALPLWLHREDAEQIKAMGLNFVRLSHYPQHPAFLDACDELGILVYAEIASWKSVRGGRWLRRACKQMHDMVVRDRNHPSVILWGMGNEGRHRGAYQRLYGVCKALDPDRSVIYAENHFYRARRKRTLGIADVWGMNYEFDALEQGCAASRLKCVVVSECSNEPHTERGNLSAERKQLATVQKDLERLDKVPYVAGFTLWCFNDYSTLRKARYKRYSGIVDAWRIPKLSAYGLSEMFGGTLSAGSLARCEDAYSIALVPEREAAAMVCGETLGIVVAVEDSTGQRCDWSGKLRATVEGPARLRGFDSTGTVIVANGIGRLFVTLQAGMGRVLVSVSCKRFAAVTLDVLLVQPS